ncbi:helicase C-terminal domain-containing protein [Lacticaseibacillus parakribbianus]|uniref:helicase C-terminal domain-containing protein n=1 Tax=Lacticaseibacillus parakribbianus TaxID=2970927 RepID=UPI0021CAF975|nr:helicase C-terminal domain-containing protein [Lacticaseibacillus parakribbianus]
MTFPSTYAVIDLETTGTSVDEGDRIIQFGCAIMADGQIIQTVSQLINPDRPVPAAIQALTGIHPADLVAAPYFEDVAYMIENLLEGKVIVAHNVNFDYPFLSAELARVGSRPLIGPAIDTVQLAQILVPTAPSFRLADLTHALGIRHDNPHRADSDAVSTAKLLWQLRDRLQALPSVTQKQLAQLAGSLIRQTGDWLAAQTVPGVALAASQVRCGRFVLRRPQPLLSPLGAAPAYPAGDAAKRKLLRPQLRFRKSQAKMMDAIYANATTAQKPLMIEAGTGLGKSLGYLLPYAYVADAEHKLVVATSTTVLQAQLMATIPQVAAMTGRELPAVMLKSARHYLDLQKLDVSLPAVDDRLSRLLQLRLIVWLTQTQTGDLDELHLTTYKAPLFARIRHTGTTDAAAGDPYAAVDFYRLQQQAVAGAFVVVTNHAYLSRHFDALRFANPPFLVVDEAQHFADNTAAAFSHRLALPALRIHLNHLRGLLEWRNHRDLQHLFAEDIARGYQLTTMRQQIDSLQEQVADLQTTLFHHFFRQPPLAAVTKMLMPEQVSWLKAALLQPRERLGRDLAGLIAACRQLSGVYAARPERFLTSDAAVFQALAGLTAALSAIQAEVVALTPAVLDASADGVTCVTLETGAGAMGLGMTWDRFRVAEPLQAALAHFCAPTFVGATLTVDRDFGFLTRQLGYPALPEDQCLRLRSPFRYKRQAAVVAVADAPNVQDLTPDAYADYLAQAIAALAAGEHQTIALFTSLAVIAAVYRRLAAMPIGRDKEVLAQGVTGSAEKIAKRFALGHNSLLLGAASFFEGIDYPAKQLEMVILTRLPFDAPDAPVTKARYVALRQAGQDAFKADALPRATLRFRQSFGRLIRTESDRGVFVVLDPRLTTTAYGRKLAKSLPNLKPTVLPLASAVLHSRDWLTRQAATDSRKEDAHASS